MDGAISIGRNVGDAPMNARKWHGFVRAVEREVRLAGGVIYATAYGKGEWEGIAEDNAVVTFGEVREIAQLKDRVRLLAKSYEQDAIALVLGVSELVSA